MKKTLFSIIIICFYFSSYSFAFENNKENIVITPSGSKTFMPYTNENINNNKIKGGHDTLTSEGILLKDQVHKKTDADGGADFSKKMVEEAFFNFRAGAHDEDTNWWLNFVLDDPPIEPGEWGNFFHHFYNPSTGKGFKRFFDSSLTQAKNYSNRIWQMVCGPKGANLSDSEKKKVYYYFGRIMHLLQDMAVPSHTKDDTHVFIKDFESYINDYWREIVNADSFKERVTTQSYLKHNFGTFNALSPDLLMSGLANLTNKYPDEEELYDVFTDANGISYPTLNEDRLKKNVEDLIPEAIHYTGAYINSIYDLMRDLSVGGYDCSKPPLPRNPAGDHPDDRFDVSDEFYWEKEFKVSEYDLLNLFMRTAIKKGKLGLWYKKLFLDKFFAGKALYQDASPEEKAAIEAEFQKWSKKLDERVNEAESDLKGAPDVALFANGFYDSSISLLLKIKEPAAFLDLAFDPQIVKDHPVMLVPSGGFYGLEKSSLIKSFLAEYVQNGGTLIVLAQQHGYDWQLLPTPVDPETGVTKPVMGYGYQEDQNCTFNSVYIDTYHPLLSNFSTSLLSIGVDGYFASYPENSTVLLRRTANGQPAMILYPYGQGYVIATTLYTDFALTHGQSNQAEINLVHNLISWAKKPVTLPEIKPGESVNLELNLSNFTDQEAVAVKFTVLDANRKVVEESIAAISLPPGQSLAVPFSYTSTPSSILGIYHVDYALLDQRGDIIQPQAEIDSGRFAVSKPPQTGSPDKPFWFFISTSSQEVLLGGTLDYAFHIINNTNEVKTLTIKNRFRHTNRERQWTVSADSQKETLVSATDLFLDSAWMFETMEAILFDEQGEIIGRGELSFKGLWPSVKSSLTMDKNLYRRNERVNIQGLFHNSLPLPWEATIKTFIINYFNQKVFEDNPQVIAFAPYEKKSQTIDFLIPAYLNPGSYLARVEVWFAERLISVAAANFELTESKINITPTLPSPLTAGLNNFSFLLENVGKIDVSSGTLEVSLKAPHGLEVFSQASPFALKIGESKIINLPITLSILQFGNYTLSFKQTDETKGVNILAGIISIPNTIILTPGFDKTYYRVRELATLSVRLENRGKFFWENAELIVSIPDANYSTSTHLNLSAVESRLIQIDLSLPSNLTSNFHEVNVSLNLPGGSYFTQQAQLAILPSSLEAKYIGTEDLKADDTINLTLENKGGTDAEVEANIMLSGNGQIIYQKSFSDWIQAGSFLNYAIPISSQATDGSYLLMVDYLNKSTQERKSFWQGLNVSGVKADLFLKSDKDVYFGGELVKALCQIDNKEYGIDNGVLNLKLVTPCISATSYHFYTLEGGSWVEREVLHFENRFATKLIDLTDYLFPDENGVYTLRIKHVGNGSAEIDYLALVANETFYAPSAAIVIDEEPYSILPQILQVGGGVADVLNDEVEIQWTDIPQAGSKVVIISAQEGRINWSCMEHVYWEKDIPVEQTAKSIKSLAEDTLGLSNPGNYLLKGILFSQTGQTIAEAEYPFSVSDQGLGLRFAVKNKVVKTGGPVKIAGEIFNGRSENVSNIRVELHSDYSEPISPINFANIPANSTVPFEFNIIASGVGEKTIGINMYQEQNWLFGDRDRYEVVSPSISVTASAPEIIGHDPFSLNINLENIGKVPATVQVSLQGGSLSDQKSLTLAPKEKKNLTYTQSITADTNYSLVVTGDLIQNIDIPVIFGESAQITISSENAYAEGKVGIPVTIQNTGQVAGEVKINFQIKQAGTVIREENKNYFLPKGASLNEILFFDLPEGDYQILAQSNFPPMSTQAAFSVRKENKLEIVLSAGSQTGGVFPVSTDLTNQGYNSISGLLRVSLQDQQNFLWKGEEIVSAIAAGSSQSVSFHLDPSGIAPGNYILKASFLNPEGNLLMEKTIPFSIQGLSFQLIQTPPYQTFSPGQEASFIFKIKNTGNQEGPFHFHFKSYDLIDLKRNEWLKPGEEKNLDFSFLLPQDLEAKDYEAYYELLSSWNAPIQGQVKYHLAGININVQAALDKASYKEGETAHLTLTISGDQNQSLFARVNYPGFEAKEAFILPGTKVLDFNIPLPKITGDKLFYGIYQESGRSIYFNSLYIYKQEEQINLMTDKQVYKPGEQVVVNVTNGEAGLRGTLTLSAPDYEETFTFSENIVKSFNLPAPMTAGTYYVSYNLQDLNGQSISGSHPFDVDGFKVKVKEASLDKDRYAPGEIINISLNVESSHDLEAILKTWIVDPEKNHSPPQTQEINLKKTEFSFLTQSLTLSTQKQGLHQLIYGIYSKEGLLLCAGLEGFEVGSGTILSLSTDKVDYPSGNEPVVVKVNLFSQTSGTLNLILNGQNKGSFPIAETNFLQFQVPLFPEKLGLNNLQAVFNSEGLSSTKESSFTYGSALPDLAAWINGAKVENGLIKLSITVLNRGKSPSLPTILKLYDGQVEEERLLATFEVRSLSPKESLTFNYQMPISDRVGANEFIALVGQETHLIDFNKNNNESKISLQVEAEETEKGFIISAEQTSKNIELGEELEFNLTLTPLNGFTGDVHLTIKDCPLGFSASFTSNPVSLSGGPALSILKLLPTGQVASGIYNFTAIASTPGQTQELALEMKIMDFEIRITPQEQTVKQLSEALYSINISSLYGFNNPVFLELIGLPKGIRANLSPNEITSSAGASLTMATSKYLKPGVYNFTVVAKGGKLVHEKTATLIVEANPLLQPGIITAPAREKNSLIKTFSPEGTMISQFALFSEKVAISLAAGDVDGDGLDEIIVGADKKGKGPYPLVKALKRDGTIVATVESPGWYKLGASVAAGDIDGDWIEEIAVGYYLMPPKEMEIYDDLDIDEIYSFCHSKKKGRGLIKVYKLIDKEFVDTGITLAPYLEEDFWGAPRVALGDIDGDGRLELITAPGPDPKAPARIKVFKIDTSQGMGKWQVGEKILDLTVSFEEEKEKKKVKIEDGYGANIAAGDTDGDGKAEIIVGAGPDPKKNGQIIIFYPGEKKTKSFQAYSKNLWGVNVASGDLNNDGIAEIITCPGPNPFRIGTVKIFQEDGTMLKELQPYPGKAKFGINVATGQVGK